MITVKDKSPPVITLNGNSSVYPQNGEDPGAKVTDNKDTMTQPMLLLVEILLIFQKQVNIK